MYLLQAKEHVYVEMEHIQKNAVIPAITFTKVLVVFENVTNSN
jgi:hypothetical protein